MKKSTLSSILLISLLFLAGCQETQTETTADSASSEKTESTVAQTEAPESEVSADIETCKSIGEYFAFTTQLAALDFTDAELDAIAKGFRKGLEGNTTEESVKAKFPEVSNFLQEKHQKKAAIDSEKNKKLAAEFIEKLKENPEVSFLESGLAYTIIEPGEEEKIGSQNAVAVNYRGSLIDGTVFDEAMDPERPVTFPLNGVIPGFAEGLKLVGNGGKIKLYIPSELGYGDNPRPGSVIEPGALLIFDLTVQDVISPNPGNGIPGNTPPPPPPPAGE
jgi:FKBP-type peptidyl-prolyl cis-trans isomerase